MKSFYLFFIVLFSVFTLSQEKTVTKQNIHKIEQLILESKIDSANLILEKVENSDYLMILDRINNEKPVNYSEFNRYLNNVSNRQIIPYIKVSNFINEKIKVPTSNKEINSNYVLLKWNQVSKLRDEVGLEEANKVHNQLENYVNKFDGSDIEVIRAKTRISSHPIVMYNIKQDMKGKELCLQSLETARKINDTELEIAFLYYLTDFLIVEGKLQEYIDVSEKSLALEKNLKEESPFHFSIITHLVDAYIYKGGKNKRVKELLFELYSNPTSKIYSYEYYASFLSKIDKNSTDKTEIFKQFNVSNILELTEKFRKEGEVLNQHDYSGLIARSANALLNHGYFKEAMLYKDSQIQIVKNIYSKDLSETLANYKTDLAVKEKEIEIENEKEKTKIYLFIAVLVGVFLLLSLLTIRKIKKQSKELKSKNKFISKTLKEKELLVKEVHHRVKNNFQIVSSLLELQSKGIEDEKALALANEGKNRVKSMALIHQKLYQNESGLVDFDEYVKLLVKELNTLYSSDLKIDTTIISDNMKFDVDTAIPLGLIINEIITNSYKYAFKASKENKLYISINKNSDKDYKLVIEDSGTGIPNHLDVKKAKTLGLRLVNRLVKQLHGTLKVFTTKGTRFEIFFKDINARQLVN